MRAACRTGHLAAGVLGALTSIVPNPLCPNSAVNTLTFSSGSEEPPHTTVMAPSLRVTMFAPETITLVTRPRWLGDRARRTVMPARRASLLGGFSTVLISGTPLGGTLTVAVSYTHLT